ncbi:MAG: TlpA family protein disulfide reductase [Solirubrobacterales bacterium]|nr:TlpA family protein disulfide reductase [Solirubrobacterales bacterium]
MSRPRLLTLPTAALAALLLAACGGSSDDVDSGIPSASAPAAEAVTATTEVEGVEAPAGEGEAAEASAPAGGADELPEGPKLPDVSVKDLAGGSLSVADIKSEKPVLVWFYAPHCPYCNEEAPKVEAFAKANADKLTVVGLGTQDSEQEAKDFVAEHGLKTPRMLYDESFASWQQLGIRSQPGAMMFDSDGVSRYTWVGAFDEQQALEVAKRLT